MDLDRIRQHIAHGEQGSVRDFSLALRGLVRRSMDPAENLADVPDKKAARDNLGLGALAERSTVTADLLDPADLGNVNARLGTFSTVADVQNSHIPAVLESIRTNGGTTPGDGKGSLYVESDASSGTLQSGDGRWWRPAPENGWVKAASFGSFEAEDHATIIQRALDTGYHVRLPEGLIMLGTSRVIQSKTGQKLWGAGKDKTVIEFSGPCAVEMYGGRNNTAPGIIDFQETGGYTLRQTNVTEFPFSPSQIDLPNQCITIPDHGLRDWDPVTLKRGDGENYPQIRRNEDESVGARRIFSGEIFWVKVLDENNIQLCAESNPSPSGGLPSELAPLIMDSRGTTASGTYTLRRCAYGIYINSTQRWSLREIRFVDVDIHVYGGRQPAFSQTGASALRGSHYGYLSNLTHIGGVISYVWGYGANEIVGYGGTMESQRLCYQSQCKGWRMLGYSLEGVNFEHVTCIDNGACFHSTRLEVSGGPPYADKDALWITSQGQSGGSAATQRWTRHPDFSGDLYSDVDGVREVVNANTRTIRRSPSATAYATRAESTGEGDDFRIFAGGDHVWYTGAGVEGTRLSASDSGRLDALRDNGVVMGFNRLSSDGTLVGWQRDGTPVGDVSVQDGVVSYNTFTGSHWSQLADGSNPEIPVGTIVETIDSLCEWRRDTWTETVQREEDDGDGGTRLIEEAVIRSEQYLGPLSPGDTYTDDAGRVHRIVAEKSRHLARFKVSDQAGSTAVYGVFRRWDEDGDAEISSLGTFLIRIAAGVTVQRGDLIESNGDGCGRVQSESVVLASTVAKVTSSMPTQIYEDGSYLVPCTLHCG